jgi:predicted nucleotidyltransferase
MAELTLLAEEVGVSERTLRRAVNEGSLRGTRPSPRKLRLSLSERGYIRRSWPLISALRTALRTEPNVRFALLFGSAARGTDTSASDVDILVHVRDASLERIVELGAKLTEIVGRRVDVVRLQDAEAEPSFLADVASNGRVLVDREGLWPRLGPREATLRERGRRYEAQRAEAALAGIDRLLGAQG